MRRRSFLSGGLLGLTPAGLSAAAQNNSKTPGAPTSPGPGGANQQVQFNNNGAFAGDPMFRFDPVLHALTLDGPTNLYGYVNIGRILGNGSAGGNLNALQVINNSTTIDPRAGISPWAQAIIFGQGGIPATGSPLLNNDMILVQGSGDFGNEFAMNYRELRVNLGPGFAQTTGPVGFLTYGDERMDGPLDLQSSSFTGPGFLGNYYYNGPPAWGISVLSSIYTYPGTSNEPIHAAHDTYPIDAGLVLFGHSKANGVIGQGFRTALQIGGGINPSWNLSKIGTGISIRDAETAIDSTGKVLLHDLPTADPHVAGQLWNDAGTLKVSAG